jgi:hypothetical protein
LWEDWQDSLDEVEVPDCRWTPCFECGVCPELDTNIQIGPTGRKLLPLTPVTDQGQINHGAVDGRSVAEAGDGEEAF